MLSEMPAAQAVVDHTIQALAILVLEARVLLGKVMLVVLATHYQMKAAVAAVQVQVETTET
jgi:hypothetical protein